MGSQSWRWARKGIGVAGLRGRGEGMGLGRPGGCWLVEASMHGPNHQYGMPSGMPWPVEMTMGEDSRPHFGNVAHDTTLSPPPVRKRKVRVQGQFTQLDARATSDISEHESTNEEDISTGNVGSEAIKHAYRDGTWSYKCFTYDPKPQEFARRRGTKQFFYYMPTILHLFELCWPFNFLHKIVMETNPYAIEPLDAHGNTRGGSKWETLTNASLKAFLAIHMYMGMKKQPYYKSYWEKEGTIFHCPIISNIMTRERFIQLRRCLHITNPSKYEHIPKGDPSYDKLRQVRWLVEEIWNTCMREWSLGKFLTIDEMMVCYKGSYSPI